jgi:hypothetical protein
MIPPFVVSAFARDEVGLREPPGSFASLAVRASQDEGFARISRAPLTICIRKLLMWLMQAVHAQTIFVLVNDAQQPIQHLLELSGGQVALEH